jgi:hypothetical protein
MAKQKYLIELVGIKDHERYLVDKDMWDYITKDAPPPADLIAGFKKATDNDPDEELDNSDDNARALNCHYLWEIRDDIHAPDGQRDFMAHLKKHDIEIVDEYEGVLY